MTTLRVTIAATILWLSVLLVFGTLTTNAGLSPALTLVSVTYILLALLLRRFSSVSFVSLLLLAILLYLLLYALAGQKIGFEELPAIGVELLALGVTVGLSSRLGHQFRKYRRALEELVFESRGSKAKPFESGQALIYSEIRRARRHAWPGVLMVVAPARPLSGDEQRYTADDGAEQRLIGELVQKMLYKHVMARLGTLLVENLEPDVIVTQRDDDFILFFPEMDRTCAAELIGRLQSRVMDEMSVSLAVGMATFPNEAVTFESLLERAEAALPLEQITPSRIVKLAEAGQASASQLSATAGSTSTD